MKLIPLFTIGTAVGLAISQLFNQMPQPEPKPETNISYPASIQVEAYPWPEQGYEAPMPAEGPTPTPYVMGTPTSAPTMTVEPTIGFPTEAPGACPVDIEGCVP